jgi:hypothetical protein
LRKPGQSAARIAHHSQNTTFEPTENLMVDPGAQGNGLRRVHTRDAQRAKFDFEY